MELALSPVFDHFLKTIASKISNTPGFEPYHLTEDTLCFYLAASFVNAGVPAWDIEMETAHPLSQEGQGYANGC